MRVYIYIYIHVSVYIHILLLMYALAPYTVINAQGLSRFIEILNTKMSKFHTSQTQHNVSTR